MKKVLLVLVAALVAFTANAQIYGGGSIQFITSDGNTQFAIAPEVGYNLADNMAVGASVQYASYGNETTGWEIRPYFRYSFLEVGPAVLFADAEFAFDITKVGDYSDNTWGVGIAPGIAVPLNDSFTLVGHVARIGYYAEKFGVSINTGSSIGLFYNF